MSVTVDEREGTPLETVLQRRAWRPRHERAVSVGVTAARVARSAVRRAWWRGFGTGVMWLVLAVGIAWMILVYLELPS